MISTARASLAFQSPLPCKSYPVARVPISINTTTQTRRPFFGSTIYRIRSVNMPQPPNQRTHRQPTKMITDPWSVSSETLDVLAGQFFAASLIPYLVFLYYLGREQVNCPKLANFGFRFLLVFVFATIPAGIYAKLHYHDILANIDWLHGSAESLLTITNLLIVLGFRNAMSSDNDSQTSKRANSAYKLRSIAVGAIFSAAALGSIPILTAVHAEPANALSFPTWVIHVSSLVEWLVAMGLVWEYASFSNNSKWKGLTWGMLPLHTSGICACTYHLFYNSPSLNVLVVLQAALTCFGNATMAAAALRLFNSGTKQVGESGQGGEGLIGFEDLGSKLKDDSNWEFVSKVITISCLGSAAVKWGCLLFDFPFEHSLAVALAIILLPTGLNMMKWVRRF